MEPRIIKGGFASDERGSIHFVNDCDITKMVRFYILENSNEHRVRGWHGHKLDDKFFYCLEGSFRISYVKVDNWDNPSKDLLPANHILTSENDEVLYIPKGYANLIEAQEEKSKLLCFSSIYINQSGEDMVRYPKYMWK